MTEAFDSTLATAIGEWGLAPNPSQVDQLRTSYEAMIETNRSVNLTRIVDPVEAAIKHYADSLALLAWAEQQAIAPATVLDVGTGAGFPAIPLAIMRPDWRITAIDATRKKVDFVRRSTQAIGLGNIDTIHAHSEHWQTSQRFDLVVTRALGPLAKCLSAAHRFMAPGGWLIAYKTPSMDASEREDAAVLLREKPMDVWSPGADFAYTLRIARETMHRILVTYRYQP